MTISGLDYTGRYDPHWLLSHGYHFVCRYMGIGGSWKRMTVSEFSGLRSAGVMVVFNAEGSAQGMKGGYAQGVADAKAALADAHRFGVPHPVVYFSADWDVSLFDQRAVNAYLRGAASVLGGPEFVGVYGGYNCVKRALDAGVCRWAWQTYAWSGGRWDPRAQIRQTHNGILGGGADLDVAMVANFGQVGSAIPAPGPLPTPTPTPAHIDDEDDMHIDLKLGEAHVIVNPAHYKGGHTIYSIGTDFGDALVRVATFSAKTNSWDKVVTVKPERTGWPVAVLNADSSVLKVSVQRILLDPQKPADDPANQPSAVCGLDYVSVA